MCDQHNVRYLDAISWFNKAVEANSAVHGPNHSNTAILLTHLASLHKELGQPQVAVKLYEKALTMRRTLFGQEHESVAQSLNNLAVARKDLKQFTEAKMLFEDALRMYIACNNGNEETPEVAAAYNNLAGCLHDMVR